MTAHKLSLALALALFSLPLAAFAQDEQAAPEEGTQAADEPAAEAEEAESNFSWNVALTSDYVFRGISQSARDPALQGGLDYGFGDSGFYVGTWGSNIDFGEGGPDIEVDAYVGWNADMSDSLNLDVMLVRYGYFGEDDAYGNIDYNELIGKVTWSEMLSFTLGYTNDYANTGENSTYFNVTGEWDLGHDWGLSAGVGHTDFSDSDGYNDWMLGVSKQFGPVNAALNYYDTNIDDAGERLSDAVVLTFSIEG
jgi:uncharacterized protein (TIGR02001 family)